jgi:hypothetical protein
MALYQPTLRDPLIRKLYVAAKRERIPMTTLLNEILEEHLSMEPELLPSDTRQERVAMQEDGGKYDGYTLHEGERQNQEAPQTFSHYLYDFTVVRKKSALPFPHQQYRNSADIYQAWKERFAQVYREEFYVLLLNAKNRLTGFSLVSVGTISTTLVHPREVFTPVIHASAAAMILLHNHPSGDPHPSQEDVAITKRLREIAEVIGIRILDHIIIGETTYVSLVDDCCWEQPFEQPRKETSHGER